MSSKLIGKTISLSSKVLKWGRESIGFDLLTASKKLNVDVEQLKKWENSDSNIPLSRFKLLSKVYKRPSAVFLLSEPPVEKFPSEFRKHVDEKRIEFTPDTYLSIRKAKRLQNIFIEINGREDNKFVKKINTYSVYSDAEKVAEKVALLLGIEYEEVLKYRDSFSQLKIWKKTLEEAGILVVELKFNTLEARAFSLYNKVAPLIALSTKDSPTARIFSLMHELSHLIFKTNGIDIEEDYVNHEKNNKLEYFCNRFAGALLVPKTELLKQIKKNNINVNNFSNEEHLDSALNALSIKFKVSSQVILRRLETLSLLTFSTYLEKHKKLSSKIPFVKKPIEGGDYYLNIIKNNGALLVSKLLEAQSENKITHSDLLNYLNMKSENIDKLETRILHY